MRLWVGVIALVAGLGLALVSFKSPKTTVDLEQLVSEAQRTDHSQASRRVASEPRAALAVDRRTSRRLPAAGESEAQARPQSRPWDRNVAALGAEPGIVTAERLVITPAAEPQPPSPYDLARSLQVELRRVGCYLGEIDGDWGPGSKRAMASFNDRVNATLPVDAPDSILLAMVQRYDGQACGKPCRSGETQTEEGRCVPTAVLAHSDPRKGRPPASAATRSVAVQSTITPSQTADAASGTSQPAAEPLPGRMAVGAVTDTSNPVPVTREGAERPAGTAFGAETRPQQEHRARLAERSGVGIAPALPSYRPQASPGPRKRHWTQTIFQELSRR